MRLQRLQSRRRPIGQIPRRGMGAPLYPRQHHRARLHGHGAEPRGAAGRAEEALERHDAYGPVGEAGRVEWASGVFG